MVTVVAPLGPDSLSWELGFRRTALLSAGRALLMQTAHPTVGAGVRDFSDFRADPWGRLDRTVASLQAQLFGGPRSLDEAARLRAMHRDIKGIGFGGEHYRALSPDVWAWVHLSNFDSAAVFLDMFVGPLDPADRVRLYDEYRQLGRVLGLRDDDMPPDLPRLGAYFDDMISSRLGPNPTTENLLDAMSLHDVPPPHRLIPLPLWTALRPLGRYLLRDISIGTLPPRLRDKLGLTWTADQQERLERVAAAVRALSPAVPARLMHYPAGYRARRAARARARSRRATSG